MDYRRLSITDLASLGKFWNAYKDSIYQVLDDKEIESKFFTSQKEYDIISFVAIDNHEIIGLSSGTSIINSDVSYITCVLVKPTHRRQKIGSKLLELLENESIKNKQTKKIDVSFFNPVHLEWMIPNNGLSDHPNSPGVDINSASYPFMQKNKYLDFAIQNAYYLDLKDYQYSLDIDIKRNKLKALGIEIKLYDSSKHSGFDKLFADLKSEHWQKEITQNIHNKNEKYDVLIVVKEGLIYGFAGPLKVQKSGRGNFAGIGVHSSLRGLGAGSVLFASLCMEFKKNGAQFMSIFTGEQNKARYIYEAEGFKIVKTWANMRKEIKKVNEDL